MEKGFDRRQHASHPQLRRWMREIVLAILLTVAAVTVISVALWRGDGANQGVLPLARKQ
jgi:heme/copper-type cytochrome/quinol oxidase subunit 4